MMGQLHVSRKRPLSCVSELVGTYLLVAGLEALDTGILDNLLEVLG